MHGMEKEAEGAVNGMALRAYISWSYGMECIYWKGTYCCKGRLLLRDEYT